MGNPVLHKKYLQHLYAFCTHTQYLSVILMAVGLDGLNFLCIWDFPVMYFYHMDVCELLIKCTSVAYSSYKVFFLHIVQMSAFLELAEVRM